MLSRQLRHLNRAAPAARRVFVPRASTQLRFFQGTASSNNEENAVAESEEEGFDLWKTLSNPLYGLPIGGIAAASAVANGFYVINEETQLLGLWVLFVGTVYHNFGGAIGEFFDESGRAVAKEQLAQEEAIISSMQVTADAHRRQVEIRADLEAIRDAQAEIMDSIVAAKSSQLKHELRAEIVSKLDNIVQMEKQITAGIQSGLVASATEQVRADVGSMKKQALDSAFAALADPNSAPGQDPVTEAYNAIFANFSKNMKASEGKDVELSADAQAEIASDMEAVARRDGLDFIKISAPSKVSFTA